MTFGVFYKNKQSFAPQQQLQAFLSTQNQSNKNKSQLVLTPTDSVQMPSSNTSKPSPKYKRISLTELIEDSIMFHTFMAHLATEFSMECLLAIVEFTEYTEYCIENFKDYLSSKHDYKSQLVKLPCDIPQSLIVYGSKTHRSQSVNNLRSLQSTIESKLMDANGSDVIVNILKCFCLIPFFRFNKHVLSDHHKSCKV